MHFLASFSTSTKKSGSNLTSQSTQDKGHFKESAEVAGISGKNVNLKSNGSINLVGASLGAANTLKIGEVDVLTDVDGNPILDDDGNMQIAAGQEGKSLKGLNITSLELKEEEWNEKTSGLKGPLKDLA